MAAIPGKWKKMIEDNWNLNNNYLVFMDCTLQKTRKLLKETNMKDIYWHLLMEKTE